jgi:periplasmic protein TonB
MITLAPEDRADLIRWVVSGAIILCAHGAIAASLLLGAPPPDESSQGAAIVIELAEMPVAPSDITPPPPEPPKEQPEEKPEEKIEAPSDVAMLPEPKPEPPKAVEEDTPPPVPTTAPKEGRQDQNSVNLLPKWQKEISAILERNKRYPSEARANRQQGVAKIAFNMDRQGKVLSTRLVTSSGSSALDHEALSLTQRSQFPPPPVVFAGGEITVTVPVRFSLTRKD